MQMKIPMLLIVLLISCKKETVKEVSFYPCPYEDFMWALEAQESNHNPRAVYMESFGVESLGLFQVSLQDKGSRYKCNFTDRESVFDPKKNRDCADKILARLRVEYPNDNVWQMGGRYFSTLRHPTYWPSARKAPFEGFKKYAAQRGCTIP